MLVANPQRRALTEASFGHSLGILQTAALPVEREARRAAQAHRSDRGIRDQVELGTQIFTNQCRGRAARGTARKLGGQRGAVQLQRGAG